MEYQALCEICGDDFIPDGRRKSRCKKTHFKSCGFCEKDFEIKGNMKPSAMFCSAKCRGQANRKTKICVICEKEFHKDSKTCSQECEYKLRAQTYSETVEDKDCELCENKFKPVNVSQKYCSNIHQKECLECGSSFEFSDPLSRRKYCSSDCASKIINGEEAQEKRKKTSLNNYGVENPQSTDELKKKIVESNLEKYGVEHPMMLDEFKEKTMKTNLEKYGFQYAIQDPEIRKRAKATNLEKYGAENPFGSDVIKKKIMETVMKKYGVEYPNQSDIVKDKRSKTNLERYGFENVMMNPIFVAKMEETFAKNLKSGKVQHSKVSILNKNFAQLIKDSCENINNIDFELPFGSGFQADLGINNESLLVDINPTISHNNYRSFGCVRSNCEKGNCDKHNPISQDYHYKRAIEAQKNSISLIQVYDWDTEDSILKMINMKTGKNVIKLSARSLTCKRVDQETANIFLYNYHIQGVAKSQSYCYGLYQNDLLMAVATFGKSRFNNKYEYEFIRYAVRGNYIIHGASGKLFKSFLKEVMPSSVVSYVDFNHTTKKHLFLNTLGFSEIKSSGPTLIHYDLKTRKKYLNSSVVKVGADRLLNIDFGKDFDRSQLNNKEIMLDNGFLPVYTAGNRIFTYHSQ